MAQDVVDDQQKMTNESRDIRADYLILNGHNEWGPHPPPPPPPVDDSALDDIQCQDIILDQLVVIFDADKTVVLLSL